MLVRGNLAEKGVVGEERRNRRYHVGCRYIGLAATADAEWRDRIDDKRAYSHYHRQQTFLPH